MKPRILIDRSTLLDIVHDRYFDLEQVAFDRGQRELRLYFGDHPRGPYDEKLLLISDVSRVEIKDNAYIQIYDISDVIIEPVTSRIRIVCMAPLEITAEIGERCEIHIFDRRGLHPE